MARDTGAWWYRRTHVIVWTCTAVLAVATFLPDGAREQANTVVLPVLLFFLGKWIKTRGRRVAGGDRPPDPPDSVQG